MRKVYTDFELQIKAAEHRMAILKYIKMAKAGHTGGDLSCTDILTVLYNDTLNVTSKTFTDPNRDRYIQSKGHAVEALYVILAGAGFFEEKELETLCQFQSKYVGHPTRKVNGIEFNTGALGHGLPISTGIALAAKKDNASFRVFTMLGDGELAEGSNWEAAMLAAHYKLDNLVAIIDHNTLQITGRNWDVCDPHPIDQKFEAFGWNVIEVDGHDITALRNAFSPSMKVEGKPTLVIANTIKGKGVSYMEDVTKWHHGVPSDKDYEKAQVELHQLLTALKKQIA